MASNTPVPFQVVKSTAEKIAETIIPERVIVSDPVNKITVIGDGVTKGGVPFGASEQWNKFYAGTLEELQADPEALAALLKDAPGNGLLFVVSEDIVNPDGTINEEKLKAYLEENYLKLTGGTMTGQSINFVVPYYETNNALENVSDRRQYGIQFFDKNGVLIGLFDFTTLADGTVRTSLMAIQNIEGVQKIATLQCHCPIDGDPSVIAGLSSDYDKIPSNSLMTKVLVANNFLPITGGALSGNLTISTPNTTRIFLQNNTLDVDDYASTGEGVSLGTYLDFRDKNGKRFITIGGNVRKNGTSAAGIVARRVDDEMNSTASVSVCYPIDGNPYATCPSYRGLYNTDIINAMDMMDYALQKLTAEKVINVGGANASDTADLHNGRGDANKPFATLAAAIAYATTHLAGHNVKIVLHSNFDIGQILMYAGNLRTITITSDSTLRTLKLPRFTLYSGCVVFQNINLEVSGIGLWAYGSDDMATIAIGANVAIKALDGCENLLSAYHRGVLSFNSLSSCNFSGNVSGSVMDAANGGQIFIQSGTSLTGDIEGKRYRCFNGAIIITSGKGVNAIPGTEAGTVDASSIYA